VREPTQTSPIALLAGYIAAEDFAAEIGATTRTVSRYMSRGLPFVKLGKRRLIPVEKARAWLEARTRGGLDEPRRRNRN